MNEKHTYNIFDLVNTPLSGTNLIEASAGTGKTFNIAGLYLRLIFEKELEVDQVVVVTYTEAATEELRDRVRRRLTEAYRYLSGHEVTLHENEVLLPALKEKYPSDERKLRNLRVAVNDFDRAAIFTIHGFCQRMLREYAFESSSLFDTELTTDETVITGEIVDDYWRSRINSMSPILVDSLYRKGVTPDYGRQLLRKRSIDPGFSVVPSVPIAGTAEIERLNHELQALFMKAKEAWEDNRSAAVELIDAAIEGGVLYANVFKRANFQGMVAHLDGYFSGSDALAAGDTLKKWSTEELTVKTKKGNETPVHPVFDAFGALHDCIEAFNAFMDQQVIAIKGDFFNYVADELPRRKEQKNLRTFDDILKDMHTALNGNSESLLARAVRRKFRAALIDEFQDTDPVQYSIFTTIFKYEDYILYLIGDPKQAIYGFRGADIFAYLKATEDVTSTYTLGTNWRSDPGLVRAVNTIFTQKEHPFVFDRIQYPGVSSRAGALDALYVEGEEPLSMAIWYMGEEFADDSKGFINKGNASESIAAAVAIEISRLSSLGGKGKAMIDDEPVNPGHMAVLVRKHRQAQLVKRHLSRYNIPAVVYSTGSVFATEEASQLALVMMAAAEPASDTRVRTALATTIIGCDAREIYDISNDDSRWDRWMETFHLYNERWKKYGFMSMFRQLMEQNHVAPRILSLPAGERRYTDLLHCAEVLQRIEREGMPGVEGLLQWFLQQLSSENAEEEYQVRLETDDTAVKIITLHRSKGLQFPIVFCPFMYDGVGNDKDFTFHDPERDDALTLDISNDKTGTNVDHHRYEQLAEQVRLFYVGLTRAKHRCYMAWGKIRSFEESAPGYLFHYRDILQRGNGTGDVKIPLNGMDAGVLHEHLEQLQASSGKAIRVIPLPGEGGTVYTSQGQVPSKLDRRQFRGTISSDWKIASYSSLSAYHGEMPVRDMDGDIIYTASPAVSGDDTFMDFPRGTRAGLCIHRIFEELDFTNDDDHQAIVADILARYGFEERWNRVVVDMVQHVLGAGLETGDDTILLSQVDNAHRLNEMEFYFPAEKIQPEGLAGVFESGDIFLVRFRDMLRSLDFSPVKGYVRGFVDLVFRHNEKYYILDWKTNWLGSNPEDYSRAMLGRAMEEHYYVLQYYLYSVALHRHLRSRLKGYNYDRHFGGVFYLFLRGIHKEEGSRSGVYHDRPARELIEKLDGYFRSE